MAVYYRILAAFTEYPERFALVIPGQRIAPDLGIEGFAERAHIHHVSSADLLSHEAIRTRFRQEGWDVLDVTTLSEDEGRQAFAERAAWREAFKGRGRKTADRVIRTSPGEAGVPSGSTAQPPLVAVELRATGPGKHFPNFVAGLVEDGILPHDHRGEPSSDEERKVLYVPQPSVAAIAVALRCFARYYPAVTFEEPRVRRLPDDLAPLGPDD